MRWNPLPGLVTQRRARLESREAAGVRRRRRSTSKQFTVQHHPADDSASPTPQLSTSSEASPPHAGCWPEGEAGSEAGGESGGDKAPDRTRCATTRCKSGGRGNTRAPGSTLLLCVYTPNCSISRDWRHATKGGVRRPIGLAIHDTCVLSWRVVEHLRAGRLGAPTWLWCAKFGGTGAKVLPGSSPRWPLASHMSTCSQISFWRSGGMTARCRSRPSTPPTSLTTLICYHEP